MTHVHNTHTMPFTADIKPHFKAQRIFKHSVMRIPRLRRHAHGRKRLYHMNLRPKRTWVPASFLGKLSIRQAHMLLPRQIEATECVSKVINLEDCGHIMLVSNALVPCP